MELGKPEKPFASNASSSSITVSWKPVEQLGEDNYYQLSFKEEGTKRWKILNDEIENCSFVVKELKPNTKYVFKVRVKGEDNEGPESDPSGVCCTNSSPAFRIVQSIQPTEKGNPAIYALPLKEIPGSRNEKAMTKKFEIGSASGLAEKEKTIVLVGATGTGKSTMVDGFINYILGVEWNDQFRFTAVDLETAEKKNLKNQALSQTQWITSYSILPECGGRLSYRLNIIDTPGFGDTSGIEKDQQIINQIQTLFTSPDEKGLTSLDAVCFLVKSPDSRLTHMQRYIFESVMSLFGKDIEKNICYVVTFSDGDEPRVLSALREAGLPSGANFTFNNSCLFSNNVDLDSSLSKIYWDMAITSFASFFKHLDDMNTRSLQLTKSVLETRYHLQMTVDNIQPMINGCLRKVEEAEKRIKLIESHKADIMANANYELEDEDTKYVKEQLPGGIHVTNCKSCNFTCHDNCMHADNDDKQFCTAMSGGYCTACPGKCSWKKHENSRYKHVFVKTKVMRTQHQILDRYRNASKDLQKEEKSVEHLRSQLEQLCEDIESSMSIVLACNEKLNEIALRHSPLSMTNYFDLMIISEEQECKEGYKDRIDVLHKFRKRAMISSIKRKSFGSINKDDILSALSKLRAWFVDE